MADGREKWLSRDQQKRITRQIDFDGSETQQIYNEEGQLAKIVQPNGGVIRFAYDDKGNLVGTKDPEGNIWKKEYDAEGNVSKEINPLGHTTTYKYNTQSQLVEITDAKGGKKTIQYNDLGQMVSYSDCSGKESAWEYDEDGTLKQQQDATAKAVQYIYSDKSIDKGQLKTVIYPDGLKEHFEHDQEGRLLKHIDTAGKVTAYHYNQTGLLAQRIDANQHQIGYQWDKQGRISTLINQNHAQYRFHYNPVGQLIREQSFDGEDKYYSYAETGRLFQIKQPLVMTQFAYHEDGKIAEKTYTHIETRQTQKESFEYDLNGQLSRASNEISQIDFYRNEIGQLTREHQHYKLLNLKPLTAVLRYQYDELGNLTKTIRPDGQEISHLTYGSGHVYGIALNQKEMVSFKRDDLHRETERYLANGLIQTNHYNDVGLLVSQMIQPEQETTDGLAQGRQLHQLHRQYHYDQNYLLKQVEDSRLGQLKYQYDYIGRLVKTQTPNYTESFSFDPAGNLIDPIATQMSQVKNNLVTQFQGKHYKYDAQGNMIESQEKGNQLKLSWDNLNRLVQSERNGQITEYGYDVFGRRLYKASKDQNTLTLFGWDGDLMIWESHLSYQHKDDSYTKHYVYEPNSFVPLLQGGYSYFINLLETPDYAKFKTQAYSVNKDPVWKNDTRKTKAPIEKIAFYHCDQVGTPQTLSNRKGECVWEVELNTWGKVKEIKSVNQKQELAQTNIRFQGQYYDEETGLHYNRYRYYEPHSGRYISKDPIGLLGGLNNSVFVSDPNQWVDPMGLNGNKYYDFDKINRDLDKERERLYQAAKAKQEATVIGGANKWFKDGIKKIQNGHQNFGKYDSKGLGKDRELDHINRIEKCTANQQCTLDYMTCSFSALDFNDSIAINLHNGNLYAGTTVSKEQIKSIYKMKTTPIPLRRKLGLRATANCMLFSIRNLPRQNDRGLAVDAALDGVSISGGASAGIFQMGVDKSLTSANDMFEKDEVTGKVTLSEKQKKAPFAVGMGVGFGGGADVGVGVMTHIGNIKDLF